jgi:excisionase family DNA binding protein
VDIGVSEAAERLGVDVSRVRQLLRGHQLAGHRVGREWLVSASELSRFAARPNRPGRPMAPARAWGLLDLLDGGSAPWLSAVARSQVRQLGRRLSGADANEWRAALRARSDVHRCQAHPAALRRVLAEPVVRLGGPAEAAHLGSDLVAVDRYLEVYAPAEEWPRLMRSLHLIDAVDDPDVVVRVPRFWPFEGRDDVGLAVLAADLLEADDPRAVAAGASSLNDLSADTLG